MSVPPAWVTQHPPVHHPKNPILEISWMGMKGQTEPAAINAPAGPSVHRMGWVFSFGARCSSSQSIDFLLLTTVLSFFLVLDCFSLRPDLTHSYLTHLPILINTAPTLIPYLLSPADHCILFLILNYFSLGPDLTHSYPRHLPIFISTAPIFYLIHYPLLTTLLSFFWFLSIFPLDLTSHIATLHTFLSS
jgi:hypothetical protein